MISGGERKKGKRKKKLIPENQIKQRIKTIKDKSTMRKEPPLEARKEGSSGNRMTMITSVTPAGRAVYPVNLGMAGYSFHT